MLQARQADSDQSHWSRLQMRPFEGRTGGAKDDLHIIGRTGSADLAADRAEAGQLEPGRARAAPAAIGGKPRGIPFASPPEPLLNVRAPADVVLDRRLGADGSSRPRPPARRPVPSLGQPL